MAGGTFRGAAVAVGGLIALQAFTTSKGAGAVSGLLGVVNSVVTRALDPSVPLIPDHSQSDSLPAKTPVQFPDGQSTGGYINGKGQYIPPTDSTQQAPSGAPGTPGNPKQEAYIPWPAVPGLTTA